MATNLDLIALGGALDPSGKRKAIGDSSYGLFHRKTDSVFLIDSGMYNFSLESQRSQSLAMRRLESRAKKKMFQSFQPEDLTKFLTFTSPALPHDALDSDYFPNIEPLRGARQIYALFTHAHKDHIGAAPFLWRQFRGKINILMTKPTYDMARWSWFDYLKITRERGMYPLYNGYDVDEMSESIRIVKAGESLKLGPFDVEMRRAGHIAGAVSALVTVGKSGPTVFFSGDISARHQHTVEKAHIPDRNVDYLVIESTYGRKSEMNREEVEREIVQATRECLDGGGKVICPAFAIGRVPELFSIFKISGIADSYPLYIDGGGRDMSLVYVDHGLVDPSIVRHFVRDFDRQRIFETEDPLVVISPSGMAMDDTLSAKYIARWASNPKNLIKLVSYQDPCSPGSGLLSAGAGEQIYINREFVTCNARVRAFPFSAHADGGELAEIIERLKSQETFLVHGAEESMNLLAEQSGRKLTKTRINEIYSL